MEPQTIDAFTRAADHGPFVAVFVLLAVLMVLLMSGFLYLGSRVVKAVEKGSENMATLSEAVVLQNGKLESIDQAVEGLRTDLVTYRKGGRSVS